MYTITPRIKITAFIVSAVFMLIVAVRLQVEEMYFMAAAMVLAPVAAFAVGRLLLRGIHIDRKMSTACTEGENIPVTLTVTNTARLPKFFLTISDRLPSWLKHTGDDGNVLLEIAAGESGTLTYHISAMKRGVFDVGPAVISGNDPFGLFTFPRVVPGSGELIVYPSPLTLSQSLIASSLFGWRGEDDGLRRGGGLDFRGVREYQYGDELRRIHWRTTARTGKLVVSEYTQGDTCDVLIALDLNAEAYKGTGAGPDSSLECAVKIAATLSYDLTRAGNSVQMLTTTTKSGDPLPNNAGKMAAPLLDTLARAQATSQTTLASALAARRPEIRPGTMLVYLTPASQLTELAPVLADYAAARISIAGFALDDRSFRDYPVRPANGTGASIAEDAMKAVVGSVRLVRKGEDLIRAMQDLLSRGSERSPRGPGRGRTQPPDGAGRRYAAAVSPRVSVSASPGEEVLQ